MTPSHGHGARSVTRLTCCSSTSSPQSTLETCLVRGGKRSKEVAKQVQCKFNYTVIYIFLEYLEGLQP